MVELVDTTDLKSVDPKGRAGSSPAPGTKREIAAMRSPVSLYISSVKCRIGVLFVVLGWMASTVAWSQDAETYFETNLGVSLLIDDVEVGYFPGFSVLAGKRTFQTEARFIDRQIGLAAPTIFTLKIGQGWRNPESGRTIGYGVRVFPLHGYVQLGAPNPRCHRNVRERTLKRLRKRGKDRTNLLCGEWNVSIEGGSALFTNKPAIGLLSEFDLLVTSFYSRGVVTFSHRWYFD